ncbi:GNAT family N-acetyltransferase [Candidatus Halocynthiibacter alkanivorans]|uniref:GNAT family N-acetyltransferase n=1 Tax=Candidatus Halocynthiibacter alkanivorans TaxID=2267619 RepID=UPI001F236C96|nr:GNAT family N-acetyltransferase [Candidatus Halocynthiibacter alkanivorans]
MLLLRKGRYQARLAESPADIDAAQRLRHLAFVAGRSTEGHSEGHSEGRTEKHTERHTENHSAGCSSDQAAVRADGRDADRFDALCKHVLVKDVATGALVCCFRLLPLASGADISQSYSAQFYNLSKLAAFPGPMLEMGRFCIHPAWFDPDIMRLAWLALTRFVDEAGVALLFGCSSFQGTDAGTCADAFAWLRARHLAPESQAPGIKASEVVPFPPQEGNEPDLRRAMAQIPPLLRSYLMMGGWVSDHAVVDRQLNTLHVFTGLEIKTIPPARARLLRSAAGQA